MKNKIYKYDFLIVGAGLIGSLTALELLRKKFSVLIIEKNNLTYTDNRTLAVNANSREFLKTLGLWDRISKSPENINKIIIRDFINPQELHFENNEEPMGSVIFNYDLLKIAHESLIKNKNLVANVKIPLDELMPNKIISIMKKKFIFKKLVFSMGKVQHTTNKIKKYSFKSTHQSYVGFFDHSKMHKNFAYEIFTKLGPLAVLPAPKNNKKYSTFIFSTNKNLENKEILNLLKKNFNKSHGDIKIKKNISNFDLNPYISKSLSNNFLLIGDTLRSIHPVAGQGWNLGVKDIQEISKLTDIENLNSENFNKKFISRRAMESLSYLTFTSIINLLYEKPNTFNSLVIRTGFQALLKISILKKIFIKQAMGKISLV